MGVSENNSPMRYYTAGKDHGWRRDPTVKASATGGCAPDGHIGRCQGFSRMSQRQCRQWALTGYNYCKHHGGKRTNRLKVQLTPHVMTIYARRASGKLKELLGELGAEQAKERLSLANEIDVTRALCERAFTLYNTALYLQDGSPREGIDPILINKLSRAVHSGFQHLSALIVKHQDVVAKSEDLLRAHQVAALREQIVRILGKELGQNSAVFERIVTALEELKVEERHEGRVITIK